MPDYRRSHACARFSEVTTEEGGHKEKCEGGAREVFERVAHEKPGFRTTGRFVKDAHCWRRSSRCGGWPVTHEEAALPPRSVSNFISAVPQRSVFPAYFSTVARLPHLVTKDFATCMCVAGCAPWRRGRLSDQGFRITKTQQPSER